MVPEASVEQRHMHATEKTTDQQQAQMTSTMSPLEIKKQPSTSQLPCTCMQLKDCVAGTNTENERTNQKLEAATCRIGVLSTHTSVLEVQLQREHLAICIPVDMREEHGRGA